MNLPNKLTVVRICMIPLFLVAYFLPFNWASLAAVTVFILAAFTDYLDGYLARKNNLVTDLGKFLDPIADKILIAAAFVCIIATNPLQWFDALSNSADIHSEVFGMIFLPCCCALMFAREFAVDALRMVASSKGIVVQANVFGKVKTVLQDVSIAMLILLNSGYYQAEMLQQISYRGPQTGLAYRVMWIVAVVLLSLATLASVVSGIIYLVQNKRVFVSTSEDIAH